MNITQRIIDVRAALAHSQGALSVANDDLSALLAHAVGLEQRNAHAQQLLGPLIECLVEEGHPELVRLAEAIEAALTGPAPVVLVDGRAA
jgi:hypothetical protein